MSIQFSTLIKKIDEFKSGKIDDSKFMDYINKNIKRKQYVSIIEKSNIVSSVENFVDGKKYENSALYIVDIEMAMGLYIFSKYSDIEIKISELTIENFDKICETGLYSYVTAYAEHDIRIIKEIFNLYQNNIIVKEIKKTMDLSNIDTSGIKDFNDLITNKEGIDFLNEVFNYNRNK